MPTRSLIWLLLALSFSPACNDLLDINPPADQLLDGGTEEARE